MLNTSFRSWLSVQHVNQIIVVDWSSSPPLRPIIESIVHQSAARTSVRVIRVDNEQDWVLSRAYNLAIRNARYESILKLDCDYVTTPHAITRHPLESSPDAFYAGYYENARSSSELHLNGALVVSQSVYWSVGGYDERIQTYGFDDEEFYQRLSQAGHQRMNISFDEISHIDHEDSRRGQRGIRFPRVQIEVNKLLLDKIGKPWASESHASEYMTVGNDREHLQATYVPPDLPSLVSPETRDKVQGLAFGRRLHADYDVPWAVIASMDLENLESVMGNLYDRRKKMDFDEVIESEPNGPYFILIHVQNGLGNRLRVLASGLSFADKTDRVPIVIWEADFHFGALFSELFETSGISFGIIDKFDAQWPLAGRVAYDSAWGKINYYNYMLKETVNEYIPNDKRRNIYFKSSAIMNTTLTTWESENEQLRKLVARKEIRALAEDAVDLDLPKLGGVHIRNRSLDEDIPGVKDNRGLYDEDDAALLDKWRAATKVDSFVAEMKGMLKNETVQKFFVASDTYKVCRDLLKTFPSGSVVYIPRDCDDRGAECEKYALADLLVLSNVEVLLGSTWSSFTEAAMRLGGPKALLAGTSTQFRF